MVEAQFEPESPFELVGRWPYGSSYAVAIDEANETAYVGSGGALLVFDISNPSAPQKTAELVTPGIVNGLFLKMNFYMWPIAKAG